MALKDLDWKQFLRDKGERIGLGVAVGLAVLMIVFYLLLGNGVLGQSTSKTAGDIKKKADDKSQLITTNQPSFDEKVRLARVDPRLLQLAKNPAEDPRDYQAAGPLFSNLSTLASTRGLSQPYSRPRSFAWRWWLPRFGPIFSIIMETSGFSMPRPTARPRKSVNFYRKPRETSPE